MLTPAQQSHLAAMIADAAPCLPDWLQEHATATDLDPLHSLEIHRCDG